MNTLDVTHPSERRRSSRIDGVTVALVIDNKDPQGYGRVRVKYPWLSDEEIGHWARIATLMAGKQRGTFFLPEVDDEVLVAFENGDVGRPYIIGALWNGVDQPPDTNADGKNNLRFIKSRSGHLVRLDDTDGSEKIEIIDKDGKNQIVIDTASKKITIQSDQDIDIEAPNGKITLNATNVEIKSSSDTKITAQGGVGIDGNPGNTDIKGATVNLN
jgi:uncharacterized protein involved in type VI secretion and phage assembly